MKLEQSERFCDFCYKPAKYKSKNFSGLPERPHALACEQHKDTIHPQNRVEIKKDHDPYGCAVSIFTMIDFGVVN